MLAAVDVEVVEEALDVVLGVGADRRGLDVGEDLRQRLVEVLVVPCALADVGEEVLGKDVEALLLDRLFAPELGVGVVQVAVVKVGVSGLALGLVDIGAEVLGDEPVEQHPEHVGLGVPAVDAAPQVVGDPPTGLVEVRTLRVLGHLAHSRILSASPVGPGGRLLVDQCRLSVGRNRAEELSSDVPQPATISERPEVPAIRGLLPKMVASS